MPSQFSIQIPGQHSGEHSRRASRSTIAAALLISVAAALVTTAATAADKPEFQGAPDMTAFHAVMAPLWHAPAGKARIPNACAKAVTMVTLAKEIKSTNASVLKEATGIFKDKCQTKPGDAEAAFAKVHDAFHKMAERN